MSDNTNVQTANEENPKVGIGAYIALIVAILFFSGLFYKKPGLEWLGVLDFTTLAGSFGKIADAGNFIGKGGTGARNGFMFGLSLVPSVMLAIGFLEVVTYYGAIRAAQRLMTPLLKPLLGIPGSTGLALITDLQSTDAGAALTKGLYDDGRIGKKELVVMCAWQYSGAGLIGNYFSAGSMIFENVTVALIIPLAMMLLLKFTGGMTVRAILNTVYRKDFENGNR